MAASCNLDVIGEDGGCALTGGWQPGAFERPYMGFDARLLSTNSSLCSELIFSAHLMQISPTPQPREQVDVCEDPDNDPPEPSCAQFVDAVADSLALDKLCLICRTIDLYRRQFGLSPQWIADYAMLCTKTLAAPPCAVATVVAAFEFVYLMDKHYLRRGKTTLVGAFARRVLTLVDIQRHFFLHVCFRTDGGVPRCAASGTAPAATAMAGLGMADKVQYSNYSFLVQSSTRAMLLTVADVPSGDDGALQAVPHGRHGAGRPADGGGGVFGPKQQSTVAALMSWKECAKMIDCSGSERRRPGATMTCCERARADDDEYERQLLSTENTYLGSADNQAEGGNDTHLKWGYADLTLLLLSQSSTWEASEKTSLASQSRRACVEEYWASHRTVLARDTAPRFARFVDADAVPDTATGPVLATTLKHVRSRGRTCAECVLCNLILTREHWLALRRFKRDVISYSSNNANLFDCISPVLSALSDANSEPLAGDCGVGGGGTCPEDSGRFLELMHAAGTEAIYKHLFCDPMCALVELQTNPSVLFSPIGPPLEPDEIELQKARLASENWFSGRVCAGLWALAFTFKTYQIFTPKPTACAAFIKDAGLLLRRHNLPLISLEHTLCNYV
ncbi:DNA packaging protein [Equid alphaherpesvirus 1]|uniref:Packaging protein UL32 n=1 Tax=Equid alphaherpesvirus 1 TaxID=10326 RepID=A0A0A7D8K0_9ALPH|nr:DNA packaging protein [Equid alphaherpesvirus 1]APQ35933.1 DNA packaging protein [Equid alphaherpesvirus 1]APQ36008.1 DNA packaging protein [Equid alphaherpesvirus 1]APQ36083.1 DNA packaging protein [Equid alphaherpesvirus 1]APQ36158.1 DNA packaging protein [Equid alphaherpesvirus 1]